MVSLHSRRIVTETTFNPKQVLIIQSQWFWKIVTVTPYNSLLSIKTIDVIFRACLRKTQISNLKLRNWSCVIFILASVSLASPRGQFTLHSLQQWMALSSSGSSEDFKFGFVLLRKRFAIRVSDIKDRQTDSESSVESSGLWGEIGIPFYRSQWSLDSSAERAEEAIL